MESLEKASKPIIIIIIIIINIKIITIIKKIITIQVIKEIKITTSIIKIPTIRGIIITPGIIKTSIRIIIILKLVTSSKRIKHPNKIIKIYPLRYKIILLRLRRGS